MNRIPGILRESGLHELADKYEKKKASLKLNMIRGHPLARISVEIDGIVEVLLWECRGAPEKRRSL
jgi:hypothetical protein